jgi:hypothetical protein
VQKVSRVLVVGAVLCGAIALAACTAQTAPTTEPQQTAWTLEPTAGGTGTPTPSAATAADPHGTAAQNRALFDSALRSLLKKNGNPDGAAAVAALASAGFDEGSMQYSAAKTSANLQPGSILVSVQLGAECLIGQWGAQVDGYHSLVAPALASGGCLVGGSDPSIAHG